MARQLAPIPTLWTGLRARPTPRLHRSQQTLPPLGLRRVAALSPCRRAIARLGLPGRASSRNSQKALRDDDYKKPTDPQPPSQSDDSVRSASDESPIFETGGIEALPFGDDPPSYDRLDLSDD